MKITCRHCHGAASCWPVLRGVGDRGPWDDGPLVGLVLLGLGWSVTMAGSALLSQSMSVGMRPAAQGLSEVMKGVAGASAGALSGVVMQAFDYPMLTLFAAVMTVPLAALALIAKPTVDRSHLRQH